MTAHSSLTRHPNPTRSPAKVGLLALLSVWVLALAALASPAFAADWYVAPAARGAGDCSSAGGESRPDGLYWGPPVPHRKAVGKGRSMPSRT